MNNWFLWLFLASSTLLPIPTISSSVPELFETWCQQHGKSYDSDQERLHRLEIFQHNYDFVTRHNNNLANSSYTLSLNSFADLTEHEFKAVYSSNGRHLRRSSGRVGAMTGCLNNDPPATLDWREQGAVTGVKDQGSCGACWSFSATGAIEGINKIATGSLTSLSEQELVDCDRSYNSGCEGGLMDYSYEFVIKNHGIDTEEDYPYRSSEGTCNKNKLNRHVVTIDGYTDIPEGDEKNLLQAVATQPVSVGICGSGREFQLYSKGIFTGPCSTALDHAVLIVGYDSSNGVDYWIVKNSWGRQWGMDGYIHVARNTGNSQGICGINMLASYPTKTNPNPPPPSPSPTKCSFLTSCSGGETCCCARRFLGFCLSWKCCELESAVCCKDHRHCCPSNYPICDLERQLCLKRTGNSTLVQEFKKRSHFGKSSGWGTFLQLWDM